ncbi:hypothetical protein JOQ06_003142 [Pogonophryne albipinna]|uniref:Uncharacterized protein n=1 Tax=Pogonophryne albipinna TaxID=1090488 RepID=A0AAD6B974_9TELE|nr:hypothetical protein JOQ06_003142 [Pogonophryne albipinna]
MPSLKKVWQSIQTSAIPAALVANITFNTLYKHAILAQLAPVPERAPAQHTTLLLGERVGVKEREQGGARGRHREDMGRKEKETQGVKTKEMRYFTPVAEEGHVFKTDEYRS